MRCANILAYSVQRAKLHQKMKMMNWQYICNFMYIWWLLKFLGVFFLWKAYQTVLPCENFPTGQPAKVGKYWQQKPQHFNKTAPVTTTVPSGTPRHHWGIGIPGYIFRFSIQALAILPPSWGSAPPVTTGSLQSLQWASPPKRYRKCAYIHYVWLYSEIPDQKGVLFEEN